MAAKPFGYLVGWSMLDRWYIGVRYARNCQPSDLWMSYFTSSNEVAAFRAAHGEPDVIEVRRTFDSTAAATKWECRVLVRLKAAQSPRWLNLSNGGEGFVNTTERARAKLRAAWTDERKAKVKDQRPGYKHTAETKAKIGAASLTRPSPNKGKPLSATHKESLRLANLGVVCSDEARARMSAAGRGRKQSPEHIAKRIASRIRTVALGVSNGG